MRITASSAAAAGLLKALSARDQPEGTVACITDGEILRFSMIVAKTDSGALKLNIPEAKCGGVQDRLLVALSRATAAT
jgi:hypothetical protein